MGKRVIVLGGGIGGLTAAHELLERGFEVELYELNHLHGGKSRTIPVPGSGVGGRPDLPGEHGFRFFPAFYRHLPDSMKRIPFAGNRQGCFDHLVPTDVIDIARYGAAPIPVPSRIPRSLAELVAELEALFGAHLGLLPGELDFFAERLWQVMTSCDQRRLHELESQCWWAFTDAANKSPAYQKYLAQGLSRSLVAARAEEGSARTIGQVQVQLMFGIADIFAGSTDRVLDGPTSPRLLDPWVDHVRALGGSYATKVRCTDFECVDGRIASVGLEDVATKRRWRATADYYVSALPVEVMGGLITGAMTAAAPELAGVCALEKQTRWMNGIQFYLKRDVPVGRGHCLYVDSPWAITSISQAQFWSSQDLSTYGDGAVRGILSVDISDWMKEGTFVAKFAQDCTKEEIVREVWAEIERSLNVDGKTVVAWDDVASWFLDSDIIVPHARRPRVDINLEPLFVNDADSWCKRPPAGTGIENLLLASDYVQTNADLACMEGANEAARRAVNAILARSGSAAAPCTIFDMGMPGVLLPWRVADQQRWDEGKPWSPHLFGDAGPAPAGFEAYKKALTDRAAALTDRGSRPTGLSSPDPKNVTLADDAYHLAEYEGASHLFWFVEWWYFNFTDKKNDRSGMVTFAVFNGADVDLLGVCSLNAAFFDGAIGKTAIEMDYHSVARFWGSQTRADVTLADSTVRVLDADTYAVNATTENGALAMELVYRREDGPQVLASNVHGTRPWEVSSWLVYMPSARVNGWITVDGERYDLRDVAGYHDHDWGVWFIPGNTWAWAAFNDPSQEIAMDVGLHAAFQKSTAYFRLGELRLTFPQESFESELKDWESWKLLWKFPREVDFSAVDATGEYRLALTWTVTQTVTLWKYPLIVFEQAARFVGTLSRRDGAGWSPVKDFDLPGYSEYTSQWIGGGPTS